MAGGDSCLAASHWAEPIKTPRGVPTLLPAEASPVGLSAISRGYTALPMPFIARM